MNFNKYPYNFRFFFLGLLDVLSGLISVMSIGFLSKDLTMQFLCWEFKKRVKCIKK